MGDMVLQENQVNPVLSKALDNGMEVTSLHNHLLWDTPRMMFMHIGGMGNLETLAIGVGFYPLSSNLLAEVEKLRGRL